ncbi:unnamed protein product [Prorocentrum cordatum]|uniref:ATP-dependent RNA helicase n=1 Tax=Prorocentrum cordatum TaxID=2364126 RepID=A0ABN9T8E4_9DINO|nr:unnamed protein product [Polarella glacialis]
MRDGFGYEYQTPVQACAFGPIAAGKDVIVRRTGAGKTLSFLLPAVERLLGLGPGRGGIRLLAVSPVRELSMQIFAEAERLLSFYPGMRAVCMVGGLDWKEDKEALDAAGAASVLLVATPGRLQTHIGKTEGFAASLAEVQILVLDEVDYLTSEIFRPATEGIVSALPAAVSRQSLFFSATISDEVTELMKRTGSAEYEYIDMLKGCDAVVPSLIEQTYCVVATEDMTRMLCRAIEEARRREAASAKLVAIFMTGRIAAYYAEAFRKSGSELAVFEIHAQIKKQETRTEASNQFRDAVSGILFTSDVSSRGLDYPGVTDVIQMGAGRPIHGPSTSTASAARAVAGKPAGESCSSTSSSGRSWSP